MITEILLGMYLNLIYRLNRNDIYVYVVEELKNNSYEIYRNGYGVHQVIKGEKKCI